MKDKTVTEINDEIARINCQMKTFYVAFRKGHRIKSTHVRAKSRDEAIRKGRKKVGKIYSDGKLYDVGSI